MKLNLQVQLPVAMTTTLTCCHGYITQGRKINSGPDISGHEIFIFSGQGPVRSILHSAVKTGRPCSLFTTITGTLPP